MGIPDKFSGKPVRYDKHDNMYDYTKLLKPFYIKQNLSQDCAEHNIQIAADDTFGAEN